MDVKRLNRQSERNPGSKLALNWRVLGLLNRYPVLVPLVLYCLGGGGGRGLAESPDPLFAAAGLYLGFGLFSVVLLCKRRASAKRPWM